MSGASPLTRTGVALAGVGAIIDLNNAQALSPAPGGRSRRCGRGRRCDLDRVRQVAAALGLDVVIVAPGGLGVSFDVLATNYSMLKEHGVSPPSY